MAGNPASTAGAGHSLGFSDSAPPAGAAGESEANLISDAPSSPLVWIEWDDAQSVDTWSGTDALTHGARSCVTVGFLVKETARELYVSSTSGGDDYCCTMIIPKSCVTRREPMSAPIFVTIDTLAEDLHHG